MNKQISTGVGIAVIVIVAALFSLGLWKAEKKLNQLQSNPQSLQQIPAQNWKTYTNSDYKFRVDYPQNYIVKEEPIGKEFAAPQAEKFGKGIVIFTLLKDVNAPAEPSTEYVELVITKDAPEISESLANNARGYVAGSAKIVTVNGIKMLNYLTYNSTVNCYYTENNGTGYYIEYMPSKTGGFREVNGKLIKDDKLSDSEKALNSRYEKILNSLKIIN
jgi:hypothetical protein